MNQKIAQSVAGTQPFQLDGWRVDPTACELRHEVGGTVIRLRPKVMELLAAFARNPGEVLSKNCLLDMVWPEVTVGDASLTVAVGELREALGDLPEEPTYIETIPRRGYRLIAPVSRDGERSVNAAPSRIWLTGAGLEVALGQGVNLIGRAIDAEIRIESPKVSRRHARITVDGDAAVIEDLGSKNGTFVGDTRITGPAPLEHGDQLRLGQLAALLRVVIADHESTVTELSQEIEIDALADG